MTSIYKVDGHPTFDVSRFVPVGPQLREGPTAEPVGAMSPTCPFFGSTYHVISRTNYGDCGDVMLICVGCGRAVAAANLPHDFRPH